MEETPQGIIQPEPMLDRKWFEIWLDVMIHPGEAVFLKILRERDHSVGRALMWVTITTLVFGVLGAFFYASTYHDMFASLFDTNLGNTWGNSSLWMFGICYLILTPIFAVLLLIITSGVLHSISRLFKSTGTWSDLVFCVAAINSPLAIITGIISIPNMILANNDQPLLLLLRCAISILIFAVSIYGIVLIINAIRAAEKLGTGQATMSCLIPYGVIFLLSFCAIILVIVSVINSTSFR
jgi:hypothetical protein